MVFEKPLVIVDFQSPEQRAAARGSFPLNLERFDTVVQALQNDQVLQASFIMENKLVDDGIRETKDTVDIQQTAQAAQERLNRTTW